MEAGQVPDVVGDRDIADLACQNGVCSGVVNSVGNEDQLDFGDSGPRLCDHRRRPESWRVDMQAVSELLPAGGGNKIDQMAEEFLRIRRIQAGWLVGIEELCDDNA